MAEPAEKPRVRPGGTGMAAFLHYAFDRATITMSPENGGLRIVVAGPGPGARITVVVHDVEQIILPPGE